MKFFYTIIFLFGSHILLPQKPALVFIEGNIGAGKSTLVRIFQKYIPAIISLEPCDEWQDVQGHNILHTFYNDPTRWSCLFQVYASMTRIRKQQNDILLANQLHIMERSWFSDRFCFATMLYKKSMMNNLEWAVYEQMWDWYMRSADLPTCFIYLRVAPEICYQRLKNRNRSEESTVSLAYLQDLHEHHEQLLIDKTATHLLSHVPVLILDGSLNFLADEQVAQMFVSQTLDFLKIHGNIDLTAKCL